MLREEQALRATIERLYDVFSGYPLAAVVHACPCCHTEADHERIHAKPLRELSPQDLYKFANDALTTWGDELDFKHFLPRMLEFLALEHDWPLNQEAFTSNFNYRGYRGTQYSGWRAWPLAEQEAVESYLLAVWEYKLAQMPGYFGVDNWLCTVGQAVDDLAPFLERWRPVESETAYCHLVAFVDRNVNDIWWRRLGNPFWADRQEQMRQVVSWVMDSKTALQLLEALLAYPDSSWIREQEIDVEQLVYWLHS